MAKKIPFKVVYASDEESGYPASELNVHNPTVHGWRSNRSGFASQKEIILRFFNAARIVRIQVLAHQYLIPERIELWLHYSSKSAPSTPSSQSFDYLGFVELSDNASTNFKSRELQSVTVAPRVGTHLKLRLGPPYQNDYNKDNQVALLAINILGEELADDELKSINSNSAILSAVPANIDVLNNSVVSVCDDLSYSMYVDESICDVVRQMEALKLKAVGDERFEYARKLKLCMTAMRAAGERMGRYALAKRQAVQQEDFNTARLRKQQIEMYRKAVFEKLYVEELLDYSKNDTTDDSCTEAYTSKPILPSPPSLQNVAAVLVQENNSISSDNSASMDHAIEHKVEIITNKLHNLTKSEEIPGSPILMHKGRSPMRSPTSTGSLRRRNKSAPRNSYEDYDERAIPTLSSHTNDFLRECQGTAMNESDSNRSRSKLNDRERRQAALPILVFGMELVELIYSRQFQDREEGLTRIRNILKRESDEEHISGPNKLARGCTLLLHRCVRDAVFSVFSQATETVRCLFMEFVPNKVNANEIARSVDKLLPELLSKSGDPSARVHTLAQHTILSIAVCPEVRDQHLIAPSLSRPVGNGTHPRLALSRIQMLEQLVLSQGISNDKQSGLACRALSEAGCSGIHHPAESVRKVAERVLLLVYKVNPRLVRKQLPPDDDITRRNLLYRQLFTEFDKIDLQRRKEMQESKYCTGASSMMMMSGILSPPHSNSSKSSPPVEIRHKFLKYEGRANVSFLDEHQDTSPERRMEMGIVKSKSGHAIGNHNHWSESSYYEKKNHMKKDVEEKLNHNGSTTNDNGNSRKSSNSDSLEGSETETRCPFCNWATHGDSSQLDKHYWKSCPVLTRCPQCSLILEVASLSAHLLNECEAKLSYIPCERCTEPVHKDLYECHMMEDYCIEPMSGAARCLLCHQDVLLPLDGGWKRHLLSRSGCLGNSRRRINNN